ncbi:transposable element Tcb1 transposase [Trichonephila clavipes]|nr:transposable element Tcb1 transposase [Trichonephila clavipes]
MDNKRTLSHYKQHSSSQSSVVSGIDPMNCLSKARRFMRQGGKFGECCECKESFIFQKNTAAQIAPEFQRRMKTGIFGSYCQKKQTEHSIRPISSALFSYRHDSFTADRVQTLRELWSICLFSLQSDSPQTLIWRAPGTRYHQENTLERHHYGGASCFVWAGIIPISKTDLHVQSVMMTGHIYQDVILEQHVRLFRGAMGVEFLFMGDNAYPHRANIVDEYLQSEDITRMDWPVYSPDLNPIEHVWDMLGRRIAAR